MILRIGPDNYVQLPDFSQSYNRYSYCLNNPLKYTDPDGENPIILGAIIGAVVGAYLGGVTSNNGEMNPLSWDYGEPFTYIGVAFGGLAGGIVGSFVGGSPFWGINVSLENKLISIGVSLAPSTGTGLRYGLHWTTHGGGGYDSDIEKAVEKAGRAYDEFVEDYRQHMYEIHTGLDAVGLVPGFDFADLLNSSLYLIEGDYTNAGISALAVVPVLGGFATGGKVASKGYSSYNKFLTKYGKAGNGMEWHHIVEQRKANINQFGPEKIHNIDNMIALPKDVHRKISAHYSKKSPIQPELTVRGWLNGQSYEFQYQYGLDVLKKFGY